MRMKYRDESDSFLEKDLVSKEPMGQFISWFEEAKNKKEKEPNAMCLSTVSKEGIPGSRFMLCKEFDKDGFKFFSNYKSAKGCDMEANPNVAAAFYWPILSKQVRIVGIIEKLDPALSDKYWDTRPTGNKISAAASEQSKPVMSRDVLINREEMLEKQFKEKIVPRPKHWGGYVIKPYSVEFWQGQTNRLHDRIRFRKPIKGEEPDGKILHKGDEGWVYERLCP